MKSVSSLQILRKQIEDRRTVRGVAVLTPEEALELIDQAISDRATINRWLGFLRLMAQRSSWGNQINELLNEYLFGTENKEVQKAARKYVEMTKLHERSLSK